MKWQISYSQIEGDLINPAFLFLLHIKRNASASDEKISDGNNNVKEVDCEVFKK